MRARLTALAIFLALVVPLPVFAAASCGTPAQNSDGWSVAGDPRSAGFDAALLCDTVQSFSGNPHNLHALVVERGGRLVAEAYRTGPDRSTYSLWAKRTQFGADVLHDVRSVTKSVVALLWGIAADGQDFPPLDRPVLDLFPALADLQSNGRERITLADMLCMRSGLAWDESGGYGRWSNDEKGLVWRDDRARYVFDRRLASPPGERFNYNGGLTAVLGIVLEQRTGRSLEEYAAQQLFEPLGIRHWEWVGDLRGRTRAYTGLRLRPRDLARIGRLMLDEGRWQDRQVVPQAWVRRLLAPCAAGEAFGHHWWSGTVWVRGKEVAWHGARGNGGQRLFIIPGLDLAVAMTAGEYDDNGSVGRVQLHLLQQVAAATREHAGEPAQPSSAAVPTDAAVETRATLRSVAEEDDGKRVYVYLKILPRAKLPFTTLRYRVPDKAMLAGLQEGASVKFRAERIDGENTLLAIRAVAPCVRFRACD